MDEPLSNLDAKLRVEMRGELARLHASLRVTTIYVTHDQVEAMTMGDRIVVMNGGRIEQTGKPLDLYRCPASVFVARFVGLPEINLVAGIVGTGANRRPSFVSAELPAPLLLSSAARLGPALLGLRPQVLIGTRDAAVPGRSPIGEAFVQAVEHHGPESFAGCRVGATTLTVEVIPSAGIAIGDRINLFADLSDLHLFDPATGRRIESGATPYEQHEN